MKGNTGNAGPDSAELAALHHEVATLKASEAKHLETIEALRKSEAYFRAITQNAADLIIVADHRARFLYVNPALERTLGYRPEELMGQSCFGYILPADRLRAIADYAKAILTGDRLMANAFRIRHKDGSERILEGVGLNLLNDPVVAGFVMNVRDVTERKRAEAKLDIYQKQLEERVRERTAELAEANARLRVELAERQRAEEALQSREALFRALIQQSTDIITILDAEGRFVYNSPAAETILGYPPETMTGKCAFDYLHPDDHARVATRFAAVCEGIDPGRVSEFRFRKDDGTWRCLECRGNNLLADPGINGIVITSRDVTGLKQAEEEHRLLEGRLNHARKMEFLGTLAGGVAHDLNNILGVLVGYSELLLLEIPSGKPSHQRVSRILQSSLKAAAIIEDLLVLARRGVRVSEIVPLNQLISAYLKTPEFENLKTYHPQVNIKTSLAPDLLNLKGSPIHLEKMLMNLVSNAAEAIRNRGEVQIRTQNLHLTEAVRGYESVQEGDYVLLSISDNGRGISAGEIEKIFEPFYTKKVMGRSGTGLGLAVVWGTIQDHDGYIDVESETGKGSTFLIYLPATRKAARGDRPEFAAEAYRGRGESILVVDDAPDQLEVAKSMLTTLGYRVHTVASGEEALAHLEDQPEDLLVLDMIMDPGIDGLETYRRARKLRPDQKAVIVSGYAETRRIRETRRLGAVTYVRKPYTLEKIGLAIREALER